MFETFGQLLASRFLQIFYKLCAGDRREFFIQASNDSHTRRLDLLIPFLIFDRYCKCYFSCQYLRRREDEGIICATYVLNYLRLSIQCP